MRSVPFFGINIYTHIQPVGWGPFPAYVGLTCKILTVRSDTELVNLMCLHVTDWILPLTNKCANWLVQISWSRTIYMVDVHDFFYVYLNDCMYHGFWFGKFCIAANSVTHVSTYNII
jgi:hypothetical protein